MTKKPHPFPFDPALGFSLTPEMQQHMQKFISPFSVQLPQEELDRISGRSLISESVARQIADQDPNLWVMKIIKTPGGLDVDLNKKIQKSGRINLDDLRSYCRSVEEPLITEAHLRNSARLHFSPVVFTDREWRTAFKEYRFRRGKGFHGTAVAKIRRI